jgi:DNA-binding NtrC family response regulator
MDDIRLVLTDIVMPDGLSGIELSRQFLHDKPGLRILYSSGYCDELAGKDIQLREGLNFLVKPFQPHQLAQAVRACLDAPRAPGHS